MSIAPSDISPWEGTSVEGSPFTAQQLRTLEAERKERQELGTHYVRLTYPSVLHWGPPTIVNVPCPIIATAYGGGRRLIVTPGGDKLWVSASLCQGHLNER